MKKILTAIAATGTGIALAALTGVLPAAAAIAVSHSYGAKDCGTYLNVSLEASTLNTAAYVRNNGAPIIYSGGAAWEYHRNVKLHSVTSATVTSSGSPVNGVKNAYAGCA